MEGYEITAKQGNHTKAPAGTTGASQFMSRDPSSETAAFAAILLTPCFSGMWSEAKAHQPLQRFPRAEKTAEAVTTSGQPSTPR